MRPFEETAKTSEVRDMLEKTENCVKCGKFNVSILFVQA